MSEANALARRETVVELVRAYEESERRIREGFELIHDAQGKIAVAFGGYRPSIRAGRRDPELDFGNVEHALVAVRRHCWAQLISRLELQRILSISRWEALWKQVHDGPDKDVPPITIEIVLGMVQNYRDQLDEMLRENVREVYEWLRPRCSEYKSNSEFGVGKRVVLRWMVEREWYGWRVHHDHSKHLSALEQVFRMFDGRGKITAHHYSEIETAIRAMPPGSECRGETTYFRFRGFKNRNLHVEFTRDDLLAMFNQVAGGGMLPQKTGAKPRGPSAADMLEQAVERARHEGRDLSPDFFETPLPLGRDTVERLDLGEGMTVLEPSAGEGALVMALRGAGAALERVTAVELDAAHLPKLREFGVDVRHADFLALAPELTFDRVLANPPFSNHRDALHVSHAFRFLKPGGVLVAIMSAGTVFREDKISRAFRQLLSENGGEIWNNDHRAFKDSGAEVRTVTVRIRKATA